MRKFAQPQVGDGDEVGGRSEAPGCAFGLLHQAIHGLDEGVATVIEHSAYDGIEMRF